MAVKRTKKTATTNSAKTDNALTGAKTTAEVSSNGDILSIDHPLNGEVLKGSHYSFRISASGKGTPQVSFDGIEWKGCRNSAGHWWFDWAHYTPGRYTINARLVDGSGKVLKSVSKKCKVE